MRRRSVPDEQNHLRLRLLWAISLVGLGLLWVRLFELQVLRGREFEKQSAANAIRLVEELPGRGLIVDRRGRVIVENRPSYSLTVIPSDIRHSEGTLLELSTILGLTQDGILALLPQSGLPAYQPFKIARDVDFRTLAAYKARRLDLSEVEYQFEPKRFYPYSVAPHVLGYIGEISEAETKRFPHKKAGDIVGKQGVERKYDEFLAGQKGYRYVVVNALGQAVDELEEEYVSPQSSGKLYLTLDLELQYLAEEMMAGRRGGLVALDPNNGEILAIVSEPEFDLEAFAGVLRAADWRQLQEDPSVPLLNRATQSGYPPGSTFKPLTLTAGIEEGIIGPGYRTYCSGGYTLGRVYHCFKKDGHGTVAPLEAIEMSCDVFFYQLGHRLGAERLGRYLKEFGFGSKTGVDVENEIAGIAPDKRFFDSKFGVGRWSPGLVLNVAIGQGEVLATPLQLAHYCGILAGAGLNATPHLLLKMHPKEGGVIEYESKIRRVDVKPETFALVREGMRRVLEGERGTARRYRDPRWQMAGKTGTAQNPHGDDHSLFIGYAPAENPIIAAAVVAENSGFGATVAAPIAINLMKRYMEITFQPDSLSHLPDSLLQKLAFVGLYKYPPFPADTLTIPADSALAIQASPPAETAADEAD
jgi:penicillin-binding protein 2